MNKMTTRTRTTNDNVEVQEDYSYNSNVGKNDYNDDSTCHNNKNHAESNNDKRLWKSSRFRDRNQARFLIRRRIMNDNNNQNDDNHKEESSAMNERFCCWETVEMGDASKFSLVWLERHYNEIASTRTIQEFSSRAIALMTSRFGHDYTQLVQAYYFDSHPSPSSSSLTLLEYACCLGQYDILSLFLQAGFNSRISNLLQQYTYPPTLLVYIVMSIHRMKLSWNVNTTKHYTNLTATETKHASCEKCRKTSFDHHLLQSFCCQQHIVCENCMWEHITSNLPTYKLQDNVMTCSICQEPFHDLLSQLLPNNSNNHSPPIHNNYNKLENDDNMLIRESQQRFHSLPKTIQDLKRSKMKKKKFKNAIHSTWYDALLPKLGHSQDVRMDKFSKYLNLNNHQHQYIEACLIAGIDLNACINEYNQSPLYIACWKGNIRLVNLLLSWNAISEKHFIANGNMTIFNVAKENNHLDTYRLLEEFFTSTSLPKYSHYIAAPTLRERLNLPSCPKQLSPSETSTWTCLLDPSIINHPGAGAGYIDDLLPKDIFEALYQFCTTLPIHPDEKNKKKNNTCAKRKYMCDAEGYFIHTLSHCIQQTINSSRQEHSTKCFLFPHMRVLLYDEKGTSLGPHVDLTRIHNNRRSTHTFLYYLTDCNIGGETALLQELSPDGPLAPHKLIAKVQPKQNRFFLFPHACPHQGMLHIKNHAYHINVNFNCIRTKTKISSYSLPNKWLFFLIFMTMTMIN